MPSHVAPLWLKLITIQTLLYVLYYTRLLLNSKLTFYALLCPYFTNHRSANGVSFITRSIISFTGKSIVDITIFNTTIHLYNGVHGYSQKQNIIPSKTLRLDLLALDIADYPIVCFIWHLAAHQQPRVIDKPYCCEAPILLPNNTL